MDEKNMQAQELPTLTLDPFGDAAAAQAQAVAEADPMKDVKPVDMADSLTEAEAREQARRNTVIAPNQNSGLISITH